MNIIFTQTAWQQYTEWQSDDEHRLTYNFDINRNLIIYSCKFHYED